MEIKSIWERWEFILEVKACLIETMKDVIMVYNRTKKEGFLPVNIKKTSNVTGEIGIKASSGKGFNVTGILSEVTGMKKVTIARISDKKKPGKSYCMSHTSFYNDRIEHDWKCIFSDAEK